MESGRHVCCVWFLVHSRYKPKPLVLGCPPAHAPGLIGPCPPSPPLPRPRPQVHQTLTTNGLRERVALRADGGMRTGRDVLVTAALGADEYGFGTVVRGLCFLIGRYVLAPLEAGWQAAQVCFVSLPAWHYTSAAHGTPQKIGRPP